MSKMSNIIDIIEAGISSESLRQKAIANNVANLQTPGYRRVDVKFKELLAEAMDSEGNFDLSEVTAEIYQPRNTAVKSNGNDVSLEVEVGEMVKNSLLHKAYIRILQKKYQQIANLTEGGLDVGLVDKLDNISFESFSWPHATGDSGTLVVGNGITIPENYIEEDYQLLLDIKYPDEFNTAFKVLEVK